MNQTVWRYAFLLTMGVIIIGHKLYTPEPDTIVSPESFSHTDIAGFPDECEWKTLHSVVDGDTIRTGRLGRNKVRLVGIDTPEMDGPYTTEEAFGPEATAHLRALLGSSDTVCLLQDPLHQSHDAYDRELHYVFSETGVHTNANLVANGLAKYMRTFSYTQKSPFRQLEIAAQKAKKGIWQDS